MAISILRRQRKTPEQLQAEARRKRAEKRERIRAGFAQALAGAPAGGSTLSQLARAAGTVDPIRTVTWLRATRDMGLTVSPAEGTWALAPGVRPAQVEALLFWLTLPPYQGPSS